MSTITLVGCSSLYQNHAAGSLRVSIDFSLPPTKPVYLQSLPCGSLIYLSHRARSYDEVAEDGKKRSLVIIACITQNFENFTVTVRYKSTPCKMRQKNLGLPYRATNTSLGLVALNVLFAISTEIGHVGL
jgi:hypothetical protein